MQSESTELPQETSNLPSPSVPINNSQHGSCTDQLSAAGLHASPLGGNAITAGSSATRSPSDAVLQDKLRQLNVGDKSETRPKPSFQRISDYESALSPSPPRKPNHGPIFTVVRKPGSACRGPQLENFPNEVLTHILSHLPASSLSAVSLVSRRFYGLVTTPHAWRIAFSRFFPGQTSDEYSISAVVNRRGSDQEAREDLRSEQRFFTRLTAFASWRSEYILRTRLLRSLEKGKPSQIAPGRGASSRSNSAANNANAVVTYNSQMFATINHIHAVFGTGKKSPRFVHGSDETGVACTSDPNVGKVDTWGLTDSQALPQFADLFVGEQPYGNGDGPAGLPNCMDLSQPFGMVYGEGFPGGQAYFRPPEEMRGRFLSQPGGIIDHQSGIPNIPGLTEAISAVWIAKEKSVPSMTDGLVGILTGSTLGVVTAYSLGADTSNGHRIGKAQLTAKWILSPGVPIVSLKVDDSYNAQRKASDRVWAVALNALGEVFYLTNTPSSPLTESKLDEESANRHAWTAGRTAYWHLLESSRRNARDDPYHEFEIPGSYSPRSSSKTMRLSAAQVSAETLEIEKFLAYRPSHFRKICEGWDMRRKLEVDFAGDDGNRAGEAIFVIKCGIVEGEHAEIKRFTRLKSDLAPLEDYPLPKTPPVAANTKTMASLFGSNRVITPSRTLTPESSITSVLRGSTIVNRVTTSFPNHSPSVSSSPTSTEMLSSNVAEEWRSSILSLKDFPNVEITASAIDMSTPALLNADEDPLLTIGGASNVSSPFATPHEQSPPTTANIPGHRGRFLAIGTNTGIIALWNMRGPQSANPALVNELQPTRTIYTDSPEISCLAVSALYIVHGGNDGLVQSWDPLGSTLLPVRTLNSRFSSRARRRLVQAAASIQGVGINLYAAGAIAIDPDPTVLRGMVSLGTHLRYWSYSSSSADQYQSKKRRLRRSAERGSNGSSDRFTTTGRGALMDYIATEQEELKHEKLRRARQEARLQARFGVGLGGLSEEEALRYAEMVSAEAFQKDEERRAVDTGYTADSGDPSSSQSVWSSSATATPEGSVNGRTGSTTQATDDQFDQDLEEAIRLSLLDGVDSGGRSPRASGRGEYDIAIAYKQKKKGRRSASSSPSSSQASKHRTKLTSSGSMSNGVAADDLDYALRLSLAEEHSRLEQTEEVDHTPKDEFPRLESPVGSKGKGRSKAR